MALSRRLCVAGLGIFAPGEQINSRFGGYSLRWLFDPQQENSVIRFWRDSSGGLVELTADVFDWQMVESDCLAGTAGDARIPERAGAESPEWDPLVAHGSA
jgi:hypothetical protein